MDKVLDKVLVEKSRTIKEMRDLFLSSLDVARKHYVKYRWTEHACLLDCIMGHPNCQMAIKCDFSATLSWTSYKTDNSTIPKHAVIEVFIIYSNWRDVIFERKDENDNVIIDKKQIYDVDVRHYLGDTKDKGKSHNHVFHNACINDIRKDYAGNSQYDVMTIWTDNCGGQYKCRQTFLNELCLHLERQELQNHSIYQGNLCGVHKFAQVYRFKGNHDAEGKVVKHFIRDDIRMGNVPDNVFEIFIRLHSEKRIEKNILWDLYASTRNEKIQNKLPHGIDTRLFKYFTSDMNEFNHLKTEWKDYIVFADRCSDNVPDTSGVRNTSKLYQIIGPKQCLEAGTDTEAPIYNLTCSELPCSCYTCRSGQYSTCENKSDLGKIWTHKMQQKKGKRTCDENES